MSKPDLEQRARDRVIASIQGGDDWAETMRLVDLYLVEVKLRVYNNGVFGRDVNFKGEE